MTITVIDILVREVVVGDQVCDLNGTHIIVDEVAFNAATGHCYLGGTKALPRDLPPVRLYFGGLDPWATVRVIR